MAETPSNQQNKANQASTSSQPAYKPSSMPSWSPYKPPSGGPSYPPYDGPGAPTRPSYAMDMYNPASWGDKNSAGARMIENTMPVRMQDWNEYQSERDFGEGRQRYWTEAERTHQGNLRAQDLAERQQMMAEWMAGNQTQLGAAEFSQRQLEAGWNRDLASRGYDIEDRLGQGRIDADRYGAELGLQGTLGAADRYAGAQRYGADRQLEGVLGSAKEYAGAQRYGADQQLAGARYTADQYSGAQRYGAELGLQGTKYQADTQDKIARMQDLTQRYGVDAETAWRMADREVNERINQQQLASQERIATMQAYGRRVAPTARWVRSWS